MDQPAAALPTEANNPHQRPPSPRRLTLRRSPRQAATDPAVALSKPAPNEWPYGTHVMVRERKSWREATIISHLDPDHWRAGYPVTFYFCLHCGATVYWKASRKPEMVGVAVGAFADPAFPAPSRAVYVEHRHRWLPNVPTG